MKTPETQSTNDPFAGIPPGRPKPAAEANAEIIAWALAHGGKLQADGRIRFDGR